MRRLALLVALCAIVVSASSASAQIIYEPVRYQYGEGNNTYYYGGSDPRVHLYAQEPVGGGGRWGRAGGYAFVSGDGRVYRAVSNEPTRTFTDALPYRNATFFGFTPNDARNEAYANVPTYFRKGDLLNAAVRVDGVWIVPAQAQPIRIDRDTVRYTRPAATMPRPLMILPRDRVRPKSSDKVLASCR